MARLVEFTTAVPVETVLVMAAGRDPVEAGELAAAFAPVRPKRLLVTSLDMTRRHGAMLTAADAAALPFSDVSVTPDIAAGLRAINPVSLARLLLPEKYRQAEAETDLMQATGSR